MCAGYVAALRAADRLAPGSVFNLASCAPKHVGTILSDLARLAGVTPRVEQELARRRPTDVARAKPNLDGDGLNPAPAGA